MHKRKQLRILLSLAFIICQYFTLSAQTNYFVSPTGKDSGDGSIRSPFKSITKALEKARSNKKGTITIYLREGKYILTHPLIFTPEDGGVQKQLILRSYPDEKVILSSGIRLKLNWQPHANGIMKATLPPPLVMDMLLVNGNIRPMARFPNFDSTAIRLNGTSADATSPQRIKKWKNPAGGYLHAMHSHDWGDFHFRITGTDKQSGKLQLEGGWQNNRLYETSPFRTSNSRRPSAPLWNLMNPCCVRTGEYTGEAPSSLMEKKSIIWMT
ncbi:DUF1565 domain-containing protein [Bacteroides sp. AN502(2024)]|uniref:DUF1565 domain-containing protein n=1 Tax=Bacteroides sp. AN502(2024) TaxID=3160599 RepID=UPI0035127DAA